ncbi:protein C19orf12 homolog [Limulus polyphemus]|uniref:Protein C19orf12 homolog n=1 Tax=Limulus polyphemus TaxID=6850 RepID=A0ABM1B946_LIMPO|nr:protein C19orf12 homolog [Limulus polyphemus]
MPVDLDDLMKLLMILASEENLKVTVNESVKGGIVAGTSAAVGGLLMGPVGLAVGGAVGGCAACYIARDKFKPVVQVIQEMSNDKKERLVDAVTDVTSNLNITDVARLAVLLSGNAAVRKMVIDAMMSFLSNELNYKILDN